MKLECSDVAPWEVVLLIIYCHGWEFDATQDRIRKICRVLNTHEPNRILRDLVEWGMIQQAGGKYVLTRKGLSSARRICMKYSDLCEKVSDMIWSEVSKQFTSLKRFMRK